MIVRPANKKDFDAIYKIENEAFPEWLRWDDKEDLGAEMNQHINFVVTDVQDDADVPPSYQNQHVIGFAMLDTQYKEGPYISNIAVHPDYQGQGAGGLLLDTIENFCRANGEKYIYLHVHFKNPAQVQYFKRGYWSIRLETELYQRAEKGNRAALFMRKTL